MTKFFFYQFNFWECKIVRAIQLMEMCLWESGRWLFKNRICLAIACIGNGIDHITSASRWCVCSPSHHGKIFECFVILLKYYALRRLYVAVATITAMHIEHKTSHSSLTWLAFVLCECLMFNLYEMSKSNTFNRKSIQSEWRFKHAQHFCFVFIALVLALLHLFYFPSKIFKFFASIHHSKVMRSMCLYHIEKKNSQAFQRCNQSTLL